jgi:hypothetical protein
MAVVLAGRFHRDAEGSMTAAERAIARAAEIKAAAELRVVDPPAVPAPAQYGTPFLEFVGDEPDDNPAEIFEAHGLIVRGEPSLFIGDPKVGKTFLLEDLMLHLAAGRKEWCGLRLYRRCRILLFLREDSERTTRRRLHQLARGAKIELWELADWLTIDARNPLYFDDPKLVAKLEAQLGEYDICAIDSLSTIHNSDENSVERMAPVMNRWRDAALRTSTAIPIVHHFRKRGGGDASPTSSGSVLQRARGSSLIGATTRHAVGVERGPAEHQIAISVESNHEVDLEPFVIRRRFGTDDAGRKHISHERVGSLRDARDSREHELLDPIVLTVVRRAGSDGIGTKALRAAAIDQVKDARGRGLRPVKVDAAADRLEAAGKIARIEGGNWRVRP